MNKFCLVLTDSLRSKFEIEVEVFVSKKEKIVRMSLMKLLIPYEFFNDMIKFIRKFLNCRQKLFLLVWTTLAYVFVYPKLNQSIKWRFVYIIVNSNRYKLRKNMDDLLDFLNNWSRVYLVDFHVTLSRFHKSSTFFSFLLKSLEEKF